MINSRIGRILRAAPDVLWNSLASLKLTIAALGSLMVLVVLCTLSEVHQGILEAVKTHFESWFLYSPPILGARLPVFFGGKSVGSVLLINLICAHIRRFELRLEKAGLWLVHFGLILLILGQFLTARDSVETQMPIKIGQTVDYSVSPGESEIALIDSSDPRFDQVTSIPEGMVQDGRRIEDAASGLTILVRRYFPNALLDISKKQAADAAGPGRYLSPREIPRVTAENQFNRPAALVEVFRGTQSLGLWTLSAMIPLPQKLPIKDKTLYIVLRPKRHYLPFSLTLKKFTHEIYPGTDIPKSFSSLIEIKDPSRQEDREDLISMNHPLRYRGLTFYQAAYAARNTISILQVVKNPAWPLPYLSAALIACGLLLHFLMRTSGWGTES